MLLLNQDGEHGKHESDLTQHFFKANNNLLCLQLPNFCYLPCSYQHYKNIRSVSIVLQRSSICDKRSKGLPFPLFITPTALMLKFILDNIHGRRNGPWSENPKLRRRMEKCCKAYQCVLPWLALVSISVNPIHTHALIITCIIHT